MFIPPYARPQIVIIANRTHLLPLKPISYGSINYPKAFSPKSTVDMALLVDNPRSTHASGIAQMIMSLRKQGLNHQYAIDTI